MYTTDSDRLIAYRRILLKMREQRLFRNLAEDEKDDGLCYHFLMVKRALFKDDWMWKYATFTSIPFLREGISNISKEYSDRGGEIRLEIKFGGYLYEHDYWFRGPRAMEIRNRFLDILIEKITNALAEQET